MPRTRLDSPSADLRIGLPVRLGEAFIFSAIFALVAGCADHASNPDSIQAILSCESEGNAHPICGFHNPEDLVPLPGDEALIVSEYGDMGGSRAGSLSLLVIESETRQVLFRGGDAQGGPLEGWGDPSCPGAPAASFSPHGIDLVRRDDGSLQLLVVQHGGRESIEFFEVEGEASDWKVEWRGCVLAPEDANLNEVVGLGSGGFYSTKMASLTPADGSVFVIPTTPTGFLYAWSPTTGYRAVPGTEGIMPNGVEASEDGSIVYMNASGSSDIRKVVVATGALLGRATVGMPDNVTWDPDGRTLLVASLQGVDSAAFEFCGRLEEGACPIGFAIVEVDSETMESKVLFDGNGSPMGAGTVGLRVGDNLFVGSFAGDRILRVDLSAH